MSELIDKAVLMEKMHKYGFTAPDMTVHEFIEDELPTIPAPRWHRVEDRLPNENEVVIAYGALGDIISATYDKAWGWQDDTGSFKIYGVTHWMPIEPPKEEEHGN